MTVMDGWKKFKNLGYDDVTIEQCRFSMDKDNIKVVKRVSVLLMIIVAILIVFYSLFDNANTLRTVMCIIAEIALIIVHFLSQRLLLHEENCTSFNTNLLINSLMCLCFAVGIYLGTFAAKDDMAVAPVWMFFFAILIFNRLPLQNLWVLVISGIIFTICSFSLKSPYLFRYDIMHALTSIIASEYMAWGKSKMKIENLYTMLNLQKENEEYLETVEEKEKETELLRYKVSIDELTGFYKKEKFQKIVSRILKQTHSNKHHVLICTDIDNFKNINDSFGHMYGDKVIKDLVDAIKNSIGLGNVFGRFGGDEFLIFIEDVVDMDELLEKLKNLELNCQKEYSEGNVKEKISLSYGYAVYPNDGYQYIELFRKADSNLYISKKLKKVKR